ASAPHLWAVVCVVSLSTWWHSFTVVFLYTPVQRKSRATGYRHADLHLAYIPSPFFHICGTSGVYTARVVPDAFGCRGFMFKGGSAHEALLHIACRCALLRQCVFDCFCRWP